jgi:ribonuclease BN (tRNA processing enzyme)
MKLTVIGSGDAFCTGGRLQAAYLIDAGGHLVLVECGATTVLGLERMKIDFSAIETMVISHLHGDHIGGFIWLFVQDVYVKKRTRPLTVYGPPTIERRFMTACEALYDGSTTAPRHFDLKFVEVHPGREIATGPLKTSVFEVDHPSGAPSHALRFTHGGKTLAFTGDSGWTEAIVTAGKGADLYLMECYMYERVLKNHMTWKTIAQHLDRIGARRYLMTHMSAEMLAHRGDVKDPRVAFAEDGLAVDI